MIWLQVDSYQIQVWLQRFKDTFISKMLEPLLEIFRHACDMCCMLCTVNTDFICSQFFLALHGYLHNGQGSEIQTQVVTWDTFETKSDAMSQLKSGSAGFTVLYLFDLLKLFSFVLYFFALYCMSSV